MAALLNFHRGIGPKLKLLESTSHYQKHIWFRNAQTKNVTSECFCCSFWRLASSNCCQANALNSRVLHQQNQNVRAISVRRNHSQLRSSKTFLRQQNSYSFVNSTSLKTTSANSGFLHPWPWQNSWAFMALRSFCSSSKEGDGSEEGGSSASSGESDGDGGDNSAGQDPPTIQPGQAQEAYPNMMALTPMSVPEVFPHVPLIAMNRNPVFPRFIKIVEVPGNYILRIYMCLLYSQQSRCIIVLYNVD